MNVPPDPHSPRPSSPTGAPSPPHPPSVTQPPRTLLGTVMKVAEKIGFVPPELKDTVRVPKLRITEGDREPWDFDLIGERYLLGRSSSCEIKVNSSIASKEHLSISRNSHDRRSPFVIKDRKSTNGLYRGKQRIERIELKHGDILTLGPAALADGVTIEFVDPPPIYVRMFQYGLYGVTGLSALLALFILVEWQKFQVRPLPQSTIGPVVIYDRNNKPLREPYSTTHIEHKTLAEFGPYLPKAVVSSEDTRFNWHLGVDPLGIARAILTNLRGGGIREGASTITQQVARSLYRDYVGTEDSAGRKIREAIVALKLEMFYSKDQILMLYLNRVFLGIDLFGFEDAAQFYFGKAAKDLDLSEAATLVGILPAPNSLNPIDSYSDALEYRNRVIARMRAKGYVNQEEADRARRSRVEINPRAKQILEETIAPYFYNQIFLEIEALLGSQFAREGNLIVETGLDPNMQIAMEAALEQTLAANGNVSQGAMVTLDFRNGETLAMVGGSDYGESQFNRVTQAQRQPGSTFKIFGYAAALEQGISPGTTYSCEGLDWQGQFFEGCQRSSGAIDMYTGLAQSENVVALRVAQEASLGKIVRLAKDLGITSELDPVPGLVLGQSEVTLFEMTGAYGAIANRGQWARPHLIRRILDSGDCVDRNDPKTCRVVYDFATESGALAEVLSVNTAMTLTDMLRGVVAGGTGSSAAIGLGEAGKTGTTNDGVDLVFVGFVPDRSIVTGVWLGNDDNAPTGSSSALAAALWADYTRSLVGR